MPFILLYWRQILAGLGIIALIGAGYYFKSVLAENEALKVTVAQKQTEITSLTNMNKGLVTAVQAKTDELQSYINLNNKLNQDKKAIQDKYNAFLERLANEKIDVKPGVGITKPYVLVGPGVPRYQNYSTGAYNR